MSAEVCILGESLHDTEALCVFFKEVRADVKAVPLRDPISLQRGVSADKLRKWADNLHSTLRARAKIYHVVGVLVHRDADTDDQNGIEAAHLDQDLQKGAAIETRSVIPVQEIEAWWLAYPEALKKCHSDWNIPAAQSKKSVEHISSPKESLQRLTRKHPKNTRGQYTEADSKTLAKIIIDLPGWRKKAPPSLERSLSTMQEIGGSSRTRDAPISVKRRVGDG